MYLTYTFSIMINLWTEDTMRTTAEKDLSPEAPLCLVESNYTR